LRDLAVGTQGEYAASIKEMVTHGGAKIRTWRPLDSTLLPIAILLILGDVFVRRRYLGN